MAVGRFLIEATVQGCGADIRLNDVGLIGWHEDFDNTIRWFVNQWVVTGENTLDVEITEAAFQPGTPTAVHIVLKYFPPQPNAPVTEAESTDIITLAWSATPENPPSFPVRLSATGTIEEEQPGWVWLRGEPIDIKPETLAAGADVVRGLIQAIHDRDEAAVDGILAVPMREIDLAYGLEEGTTAADMVFKEAWRDSAWDVEDIRLDNLSLRVHGSGRLLEVTDKKGGAAVRALPTVKQFNMLMRVFLSRIGGTLTVVR